MDQYNKLMHAPMNAHFMNLHGSCKPPPPPPAPGTGHATDRIRRGRYASCIFTHEASLVVNVSDFKV